MKSDYNSRLIELRRIVKEIKENELALESFNQDQEGDLLSEKAIIENNLDKLKAKKNELNEELIENDELFETLRMKYAVMILLNYGNNEPEYCL